jgi:hypothetical protein
MGVYRTVPGKPMEIPNEAIYETKIARQQEET